MTDPNAPAYPNNDTYDPDYGLTKREYFAALALGGWMARTRNSGDAESAGVIAKEMQIPLHDVPAYIAVLQADALIQALNKPVP